MIGNFCINHNHCRTAFSHSREKNKDFSPLIANQNQQQDKLDLANLGVEELENRFNLTSKKNSRRNKNRYDSKKTDKNNVNYYISKRVLSPKLKVYSF